MKQTNLMYKNCLNNFIDTTIDDYYSKPYKFIKKDNYNNIVKLSKSENDLNILVKKLTSIIMNNSNLDNYHIDNNNNNINTELNKNIKVNKYDDFIIFKLVANNNINKLKNINFDNYNINIQDVDGDTALHIAIFLSNYEACEILIKNNINLFIKDKWSQLSLHRICFSLENNNTLKIIDLINNHIQKNFENKNIFNELDKFNNTPFHLVIKYILKNKIILNKNIIKILDKLVSLTNMDLMNNDGLSCNDLINMLNFDD